MNIKRTLMAFSEDTKIKYIINGNVIAGYDTVKDFVKSGLTTYTECENGTLTIENDTIIINV